MDVIALRKRAGTIQGEVRLNGWPQEPISFRRCSGYVEQFDVQTPELTVRECIMFSAKLRLDPTAVHSDQEIGAFVDQVMDAVELTSLGGVVVGTDDGFGLSFEQKKRLSIAVELAASPSIIFLDEPVSASCVRHYKCSIAISHS
jgi:ABC-type multidrug transport system ATPase subunit